MHLSFGHLEIDFASKCMWQLLIVEPGHSFVTRIPSTHPRPANSSPLFALIRTSGGLASPSPAGSVRRPRHSHSNTLLRDTA